MSWGGSSLAGPVLTVSTQPVFVSDDGPRLTLEIHTGNGQLALTLQKRRVGGDESVRLTETRPISKFRRQKSCDSLAPALHLVSLCSIAASHVRCERNSAAWQLGLVPRAGHIRRHGVVAERFVGSFRRAKPRPAGFHILARGKPTSTSRTPTIFAVMRRFGRRRNDGELTRDDVGGRGLRDRKTCPNWPDPLLVMAGLRWRGG